MSSNLSSQVSYVTHVNRRELIPHRQGDAGVGKSSLLIRLTDQRFLANPDPTVRVTLRMSDIEAD